MMTDTERAILFFENAMENCVMVARKPFETALAALRKAAEYEQSVEVGAVVYTVYSDEDGSFVEELTVTEISTHRFWATGKCFVHGEIGKTVFLTRAEAKAALGGGEGLNELGYTLVKSVPNEKLIWNGGQYG